MGGITLSQEVAFLLSIAGVIGALTAIYNFGKGVKKKTVDETIKEELKPIKDSIQEIQNQNKKLSEEMALLIKLTVSMASELEEGEVNGKTAYALGELNDYIVKTATDTKK